ncbi:amino acid ABC transporter permease [Microbacterium terricola]|uniref:ABC transporter permease n=1 Tax=Microbacterium terricola TaxID=344163 RepID=A0ABM8DWI5_9MICO|nr:amino acid ABC transporter permease [Microbacterium terricola]UYK39330.1 amino acid ABC transporter permease [Microbacterium terricola]BDV29947.1 ABC transporter permease [Microbacterium terricola]
MTRAPAPVVGARREVSAVELERQAYRKRQGGRSVVISLISTLVVAALIWVAIINTPGWARVQQQFFNGEVFLASLPRVWDGFLLNLRVLAMSAVLVLLFGMLLATVRTLRGPVWLPLRALAAGYTDVFRGIPLIIVLYLVGFGIPGLQMIPVRMPTEFWGTIAITLTYSAYVSEVFRAGIEAVHPSQRHAARSLGLSHAKTMRLIVVPQAVRKVTPALMNDFVAMQKDVGLISLLGAVDAVRAAQIETAAYFNFTPYVVAALLFVLLAIPTIRLTDWYTARVRAREQIGGIV